MRRIGNALRVLLGLALLLALVGAIGWLVYTTVTEAPAVVAAVITGMFAILALGVQRYFEQQREDLGVSNDGLERGDLLRIFINDLDDHLLPTTDEELSVS